MKRSAKLALDVCAFALYAVVSLPTLTGVGVHEWLGLGILAVLAVHIAAGLGAVVRMARPMGDGTRSGKAAAMVALDALLLAALAVCAVSGLLISGTVLPSFGLFADGYYFWNPLHAASAKLLLALLLVHVVAHWRWIANAAKGRVDRAVRNAGE